jgi:dTMP kinase
MDARGESPPPAGSHHRHTPGPVKLTPFIVFEGIEGSGKSTQIARLSAQLARAGRAHLVTREPGGTPLGGALRELLLSPASTDIDGLTELYLLEASRRMHVLQVIRPALVQGVAVLCDRFGDSSVAYQGGGRHLGVATVELLNAQATEGLEPDVTILLDLPVADGLARVGRRGLGEDRMEREALAFHERVRQTYLEIARRRKEVYRVIAAEGPPDAVFAEVARHLAPYFEGCLGPH